MRTSAPMPADRAGPSMVMKPISAIPTAADVMLRDPVCLRPDMEVEDAVKTLLRKRISGAPVVEHDRLVGIFSERDALAAMAGALYDSQPNGPVSAHMRRNMVTISPDTDLFVIASRFERDPVRRLPVVDADGRLLGLVLRSTALAALVARTASAGAHPAPPKTLYERVAERLADP